MRASENAYKLIKESEGLKLEAYQCPAGLWTIGYGHTGRVNGKAIQEGLIITEEIANELLENDVRYCELSLDKLFDVELNQNQFDALIDFVFNLGEPALRGSTLRKYINNGHFELAAAEFGKWVHAGKKVLPGLVIRREKERQLFEA